MTDPDRSSPDRTAAPDTVETLQARVEALYLESRTLHRKVRRLQAVQPVLGLRPRTPSPVMRLAMRLMPGLRRRHHLRTIRESGLFDGDWYLAAYPDVAAAGLDPAVHFLSHGADERRNPGPFFDTAHYLALYPDIAESGLNPLVHYLQAGWAEGRSIRPGMPPRNAAGGDR